MGSGNPWERREELGFGTALIEALKLFIKSPAEAFSQTRRSGDFASPLLFALIVGWLGMAIQQIWSTLMGSSLLSMMPAEVRDQVGMYWAGSGVGLITTLIFAPFFILVGTFVWAAILHLCLMVIGGLKESPSGFEGTYRVIAYSSVAQFGNLIPIVGGLVAAIWGLVLAVMGITDLHRSSQGQAIAALLIPLVICCVCVTVAAVLFGAGIAAMIAGRG